MQLYIFFLLCNSSSFATKASCRARIAFGSWRGQKENCVSELIISNICSGHLTPNSFLPIKFLCFRVYFAHTPDVLKSIQDLCSIAVPELLNAEKNEGSYSKLILANKIFFVSESILPIPQRF